MSKNKKKVTHSKKEEEQAKKVVKIVFVSLVILALAMIIGFSLLGWEWVISDWQLVIGTGWMNRTDHRLLAANHC